MKAIKLTDEQMNRIETAIARALDGKGIALRAAKIERHPAVVAALGTLPAGKSDMRHLDSALQRMRRADVIKYTAAGWRLA